MITYRKANSDDVFHALVLWCKVWDEFIVSEKVTADRDYNDITRNSGLLKKYVSGERVMLIAADDEKVVGAIGADINGSSIKPPVCVDSRYHRQGIATELLRRMVCELSSAGCASINVDSSSYALPFYKKFGFVQIGAEQKHSGFVSIQMEYTFDKIRRKT